ncbi:superoxide dismutase family protein [Stakelama sediminis]|uniref:Cu-Zn family superoxide dismutase n=1 Tax=Stakelama sediminis TaxID=463200 RepID=A0A840YXC7_9SPHN|nr:superoxide dismutase family protein [Stakelama sediminis]MBB5718184.1 Cu-Zn family superoxide dismutase [Stakelama sediminis]
MVQLRSVGIALIGGAALSLMAAGCSTMAGVHPADAETTPAPASQEAIATLRTGDGAQVGTATATELPDGGVRIAIDAHDLPPGVHGAHVHTTGRCAPPDFASAGGHWNPTGTHHGISNPENPKPHAGDMPNLMIGTNGEGSLAVNLPAGTFAGLMDADGSALVIHAGADDLKSDPSGNSGARIACGVFMAA